MTLRSVWHNTVQRLALWLCCRILAAPVWCGATALVLYVAAPWLPAAWFWDAAYAAITLLALAVFGPEPGKHGSTLLKSIPYGYRRRYVHTRFRAWMIDADMVRKPNSEGQVVRWHPNHKRTPKLARRWTCRTPYGMAVVAKGHKLGKDDYEFEKLAPTIRSLMGCHDVFFEAFEGLSLVDRVVNRCFRGHRNKKRWTRIDMVFTDPFAKTITTSMLPRASRPDRVVVGLDERGRPVEKSFKLSQLIAGESNSGKSTEVRMQLLGLVRSGMPFVTLVFDPKQQEYLDIKDRAYLYQDDRDIAGFLRKCLVVLERRQKELAALGLPDYPAGDPRFPRILILFDELITALAAQDRKDRSIKFANGSYNAEGALMELLSTGRSAGVTCIANTQLVQKSILDLIRDLFPHKTFLRLPSIDATRICFPGEGQARVFPAHTLPKEGAEGVGWTEVNGQMTKYRGALPSKAERAEVAEGIGFWTERYRATPVPVVSPNGKVTVDA